jgi:hypothetical protein
MKKSQLKKLIREVISEVVSRGPTINGKEVDRSSIEMDGVDPHDYPDFSDAYIVGAQFVDGTELTQEELELLNNEGELVSNSAHEKFSDQVAGHADRMKDDVREDTENLPKYKQLNDGLYVRDDVAEKIIKLPTTRESGDKYFFMKARYDRSGGLTGQIGHVTNDASGMYQCELALKKHKSTWMDDKVDASMQPYHYVVVGVSGSYGFGGLQMTKRETLGKRIKKQLHDQAIKFIDNVK